MSQLWLPIILLASPLFAISPRSENVVLPLSSSAQILIPAAGSLAGANNTFFRSEINVLNYGTADARLQFRWLPRAGEEAGAPVEIVLPAGRGFGSDDFVASALSRTGLGAIVVSAVTAGGSLDSTAKIYVSARIWTPQPGTNGFTSQTFDVVPLNAVNSSRLAIVGLRRDAQYRLNVGIVNLDAVNGQSFQITVGGGSAPAEVTSSLNVPPLSMQQFSVAGAPQTGLQVVVENVTDAATRSNSWIAYGSSVDNVTGDSWSMLGFVPASATTP